MDFKIPPAISARRDITTGRQFHSFKEMFAYSNTYDDMIKALLQVEKDLMALTGQKSFSLFQIATQFREHDGEDGIGGILFEMQVPETEEDRCKRVNDYVEIRTKQEAEKKLLGRKEARKKRGDEAKERKLYKELHKKYGNENV